MRFEILGPLRVIDGPTTLSPGSPQQQKVLALLLASPNQVVSSDRLIDQVWGEQPPPSARHLVQNYVWRLRKLIDDFADPQRILSEGRGYAIRVAAEDLDALELVELVDKAQETQGYDTAAAERLLGEAVAMWRGRPFGDLSDDSPTLRAEATRLEEIYLRAVTKHIDARLELGDHQELVGELESLTTQYPYRERIWEQRMLALYRSGRQAEALRLCQTLRKMLGEDLGIEPGPAMNELEGRILLHDVDLLWEPPPPPSNLPTVMTSFVGRTSEIAEVVKLLDTYRQITLTGPGGVGKTRLAIEVAKRVLSRFPDGVWWIDLAPLSDPLRVVAAIAEAFGVSAQPDTPLIESVTRSLERRRALLLVDNCEHVAAAVADVVTSILLGADRIRVVATSRTPLHVSGEVLWNVPALAVPLTEEANVADLQLSDAIRLLIERGTAVDRTFAVSDDNARSVVELCRRLDGMPLAIEMAASRLGVLSPAQIVSSLDDRFSLLTRPEQGAVARHETLKTTIDWSYQLLEPGVRRIFDRLSTFAGAFGIEETTAIAFSDDQRRTPLEVITDLVHASMVTTTGTDTEAVRYRLLETLRAYGTDRLRARGESDSASKAHADYFLGLAIEATDAVETPGFADWVQRFDEAYADLREALGWAMAHAQPDSYLPAAPALFQYWYRTFDPREAEHWGLRLLRATEGTAEPLRAWAHLALAFSGVVRGKPDEAQANSAAAIEILRKADSRAALVTALFGAGNAAIQVGDFESARAHSRQALTLCDELGDRWRRAGPLAILSFAEVFGQGSLEAAGRLAEEAVSLYRDLGDIVGQVVMNPLSVIALRQGKLETAERHATDAASVAVGTAWEGTALVNLAEVLMAQGDAMRAQPTLQRAMTRALDAGVEIWFRIAIRDLAQLAADHGDVRDAARLIGASRRNAHHYGLDATVYQAVEAKCRDTLDAEDFTREADTGYHMTHEELLTVAAGI
jgi:predicted ATPase/DNA-binding SARP family transcriptional activator